MRGISSYACLLLLRLVSGVAEGFQTTKTTSLTGKKAKRQSPAAARLRRNIIQTVVHRLKLRLEQRQKRSKLYGDAETQTETERQRGRETEEHHGRTVKRETDDCYKRPAFQRDSCCCRHTRHNIKPRHCWPARIRVKLLAFASLFPNRRLPRIIPCRSFLSRLIQQNLYTIILYYIQYRIYVYKGYFRPRLFSCFLASSS